MLWQTEDMILKGNKKIEFFHTRVSPFCILQPKGKSLRCPMQDFLAHKTRSFSGLCWDVTFIFSHFKSSVMESRIVRKMLAICTAVIMFAVQAQAQNKEADKAKEALSKAMEQKDAAKRQDGINKAREMFQKAGLKPQEVGMILGDAYLEKGDLVNAANSYSTANKEDKKEGFKKVAEAYLANAFTGDEKAEAKAVNKSLDFYRKAGSAEEGARAIGDKYYEKGPGSYNKALDYYVMGKAEVKVEQIAKEYFDKGGDNEEKAAEVYLRLKTPVGYKKAGDIYFDRKQYQKAIDAYQAGNVSEGIKRYAEHLYSQNRNEEADNFIVKVAEVLATAKDDNGLEKLANEVTAKGSYSLAARIYDKAGNTTMSDKCNGYAKLIAFDLEGATQLFNNVGDAAMVKTIADNTKLLTPLKDVAENFDEIMKGAPFVTMIVDSVSGTSTPSASDQKTLEEYYKSVRDQIVKNVFDVSANMAKLTNPDLRKYAKLRFMRYGAIRKILDTDTFAIKKQKADIKVKDVIL
jgi:tetratricopeptide (TPR) repeat protein